jgi:hypothetical protein
VSGELSDLDSDLGIPHVDDPLSAGEEEALAVRREDEVVDRARGPGEAALQLSALEVPDVDLMVAVDEETPGAPPDRRRGSRADAPA